MRSRSALAFEMSKFCSCLLTAIRPCGRTHGRLLFYRHGRFRGQRLKSRLSRIRSRTAGGRFCCLALPCRGGEGDRHHHTTASNLDHPSLRLANHLLLEHAFRAFDSLFSTHCGVTDCGLLPCHFKFHHFSEVGNSLHLTIAGGRRRSRHNSCCDMAGGSG
jgi:hypothetical protein